jgi:hypothetical protein
MVTPIVTEIRRHGGGMRRQGADLSSPAQSRWMKRMSIQAVLSRIDVIAQAQQQLATPTGSSTSASAIGAMLSGTSATGATTTGATSFASALAQAQGTSPGTPSTAIGVAGSTGVGVAGSTGVDVAGSTGVDATATAGVVPGAVVPQASWNPAQKPIAGWIAPILDWASQHGWTGTVTSGYRDYSQQASLNASGAYSAPAGKSNHESTQYPGGAVDVTDPAQLMQVLQGYAGPDKLVGGVLGPVDPEHFSATGH